VLAARCRDRNERNGATVSAKLRRIESLLVTLRGGQDRVAPVYGASGARALGAASIDLGCA
jgi:flagellar biosynthesis/type III secretory pathway chaperone